MGAMVPDGITGPRGRAKGFYRLTLAALLLLSAALIFIPNRYWRAASKRLVPPARIYEAGRADPWG